MEEPKEQVDQAARTVARGRWEGTPFAALAGVGAVALAGAGLIVVLALVLWLVLR